MSLQLTIAEIAAAFPNYRVAVVVAEGLTIPPERPEALDVIVRHAERGAREAWAAAELAQIPGIAAWRAAYKGFGIRQTRYRSSVERLVKNVLAGRELARINAFVDLYNAVSLKHVLPLGADDLDKIAPPLAFRFARDRDSFVDMAEEAAETEAPKTEAPKPGEVVYADRDKVLCRRWNWRQDARSLITDATSRAVVTLQSNGTGDVGTAAQELNNLIVRFCGGQWRMGFADAANPTIEV